MATNSNPMSLSERLGAVLALIPAARDEVRVTAKGAHAAATVEFYGAAAALLRSEDGPALVAAVNRVAELEAALSATEWPLVCAHLLSVHVQGHFALPTDSSVAVCKEWAEKTKVACDAEFQERLRAALANKDQQP